MQSNKLTLFAREKFSREHCESVIVANKFLPRTSIYHTAVYKKKQVCIRLGRENQLPQTSSPQVNREINWSRIIVGKQYIVDFIKTIFIAVVDEPQPFIQLCINLHRFIPSIFAPASSCLFVSLMDEVHLSNKTIHQLRCITGQRSSYFNCF